MTDPTAWLSGAAVLISSVVGIFVATSNRKSQAEANKINGTGQLLSHQNTFLQDLQEERTVAKEELKVERESNAKLIADMRQEFESFKESVKAQFSGYRAYIHGLRGQVHDLGGTPIEWPPDLEQ
jgi:hypothetical protein